MILNTALAFLNTRIWLIFLLFTQGAMYTMKRPVIEEKKPKHANWNHMHAIATDKPNISANAVMVITWSHSRYTAPAHNNLP